MSTIKTKHVDRPDVDEVFADGVRMVTFRDGVLYIELVVTRLDEPRPPQPPTGTTRTTARLALSPTAALQLHGNLTNLITALEQQGMVKKAPVPPQPAAH